MPLTTLKDFLPSPHPTLSHFDYVHIITPYFYVIHFNIMLLCMSCCPKWPSLCHTKPGMMMPFFLGSRCKATIYTHTRTHAHMCVCVCVCIYIFYVCE